MALSPRGRRRGVAVLSTSKEALEDAPLLPRANTTKHVQTYSGKGVRVVAVGMQGWRKTMEDAVCVSLRDDGISFLGVFDGHVNGDTAVYCAEKLPAYVDKALSSVDMSSPGAVSEALVEAFVSCDVNHRSSSDTVISGSTATTCIFTPVHIVCASCGDARSVLYRKDSVVSLSVDHKPELESEQDRIVAAGLSVVNGRVDGKLGVSRGFGDYYFKNDALRPDAQAVSCVPQITFASREDTDAFLVLGCDGIWEVIKEADLGALLTKEVLIENKDLAAVVEKLVDDICPTIPFDGHGPQLGYDNMSLIVLQFLS
eukprot:PhF_6_TR42713/c0_g1_i1/m.64524/K04461/PPM1B, PP2CB; protein phosphatase 1B